MAVKILTQMAKWPRSVRRIFGASSVHNLYIQQTLKKENIQKNH